jgi:hypothetical protein
VQSYTVPDGTADCGPMGCNQEYLLVRMYRTAAPSTAWMQESQSIMMCVCVCVCLRVWVCLRVCARARECVPAWVRVRVCPACICAFHLPD